MIRLGGCGDPNCEDEMCGLPVESGEEDEEEEEEEEMMDEDQNDDGEQSEVCTDSFIHSLSFCLCSCNDSYTFTVS